MAIWEAPLSRRFGAVTYNYGSSIVSANNTVAAVLTDGAGDPSGKWCLVFPVPRYVESIESATLSVVLHFVTPQTFPRQQVVGFNQRQSIPVNGDQAGDHSNLTSARQTIGFNTSTNVDQQVTITFGPRRQIDVTSVLQELLQTGSLVNSLLRLDVLPLTSSGSERVQYHSSQQPGLVPILTLDYTPKPASEAPVLTESGESLVANFGFTGDYRLRLFSNDVSVDRDTVLSDLTEASFAGYTFAETAKTGVAPIDGATEVTLSGGTFDNNSSSNQTVYGWYLTSASLPTAPLFVHRFESPLVILPNSSKEILPKINLRSQVG